MFRSGSFCLGTAGGVGLGAPGKGVLRCGMAGELWRVMARHGLSGQGLAGMVWTGMMWQVESRLGMAGVAR